MNKSCIRTIIYLFYIHCSVIYAQLGEQNVGTAYCGPYEISEPLVLDNIHDTVISGLEITNPNGHSIQIRNCSNITIQNCLLRNATGNAVDIYNSTGITVINTKMDAIATGVYALASSQIQVLHTTCVNVLGPKPRGQLVQFDKVYGENNKINYNVAENIFDESYPEDVINIYKSNGTPNSPIEVKGNWIRGGGPSGSGGGIMTGDNGGSYIVVEDNILVNPGQYGVAIAGGNNIKLLNNLIYAENIIAGLNNVGIYVWKQSDPECSNHTVSGNRVNYTDREGKLNPYWDGTNCGEISGWNDSNTWYADIDASILPEVLVLETCYENAPEESLIAHYTFNHPDPYTLYPAVYYDQILDVSGNELHGTNNTITSGSIDTNYATGEFNGVDARSHIPTDPLLVPEHITVTAWIKPHTYTGSKGMGILKSANGSGYYTGWRLVANANSISAGVVINEKDNFVSSSASGLIPNEWNFVTFTYDGNTIKTSINNEEPSTKEYSGTIFYNADSSTSHMSIGYTNGTDYFDGEIGDLKLYNTALSEEALAQKYEQLKAYYENDRIASYEFNANVLDTGGNHLHGTNHGVSFGSDSGFTTGYFGQNTADSYLSIENSDLLSLDKFTVSTWIKPMDTESVARGIIKSANGNGWNSGWRLITDGSRAVARVYTYPGGGVSISSAGLVANQWNLVTFSYNSANAEIKVYVNGNAPVIGNTEGVIDYGNSAPMWIGKSNGVDTFKGEMDNLQIFGTVLTDEEVSALYTDTDIVLEEKDMPDTKQMVMYPNPSSTLINITYPSFTGNENLQIIDTHGREILTKKLNSANLSLDISDLAANIYFVKITGTKGQTEVKKLIVK